MNMASVWVKRGIAAAAVLAVIVVLAIAGIPYVASTQLVRDRIAQEMSAWTGYRVSIGAAPAIEIWPSFRAILTDVSLSEWSKPDDHPVIEADRVEIELSAIAALRGNVVFHTARMVRPVLRLERGADGMPAPTLPDIGRFARSIDAARRAVNQNPANPDTTRLPSDAFGMIELSDGKVVIATAEGDVDVVTSISGRAAWPALNRGASVSVTGIWRGESVTLEAASPRPLLLIAGGSGQVSLSFKSAPATASFEGVMQAGTNGFFEGQAKFTTPSLRRTLEWAGTGMAPGTSVGSVSLASRVTGNAQRVKFENAQIAFGENSGMGALDLLLTEAVPALSGTLAFETLDLNSFLAALTPTTPLTEGDTSDEPDVAVVPEVNLDLRLSAARATVASIALSEVAATTQVRGGLTAFDISDASAFGGTIQTGLRLDRKPEGAQMELRLLASDIDGGAFGAAAGMKPLMPTGRGTISVILKGPGTDWNSMLERADGSVTATFGRGDLAGLDLDGFLKRTGEGGFFSLAEVSNKSLPIEGAELKASVVHGVARIEKAEARTANRKISLTGIVPIAGRGLALSGTILRTDQTAQPDAALPEADFFVGGSWDAPFIAPVTADTPKE